MAHPPPNPTQEEADLYKLQAHGVSAPPVEPPIEPQGGTKWDAGTTVWDGGVTNWDKPS